MTEALSSSNLPTQIPSNTDDMEKLHTNDNNSNGRVGESATEAATGAEEESPVIDIVINNVVCTFSVRCHLNLKKIAMEGMNVEYKKEQGVGGNLQDLILPLELRILSI